MTESNWPTEKLKLLAEACDWEWVDSSDGKLPDGMYVAVSPPGIIVLATVNGFVPFSPATDNGELLLAMLQSEGWRPGWNLRRLRDTGIWFVWQLHSRLGDGRYNGIISQTITPTEAVAEAILAARREKEK